MLDSEMVVKEVSVALAAGFVLEERSGSWIRMPARPRVKK
jgi:hypothetical protein